MVEEFVERSSWGVMLAGPHWLLLGLLLVAFAGVIVWRASWKDLRPRLVEERGQYDPVTLLITVIVVIILVVLVLKVLAHV